MNKQLPKQYGNIFWDFWKVSSDSAVWATQFGLKKLTVNMMFSGQLLGTPESDSKQWKHVIDIKYVTKFFEWN